MTKGIAAMHLSLIIFRILILMAMILAGWACTKTGVLKPDASKTISALIMNISLPCQVFSILLRPMTNELLQTAGKLTLLALLFYAVGMPLSSLYSRLIGAVGEQRPPHRCAFIFSNVGFMGLPIAGAFFNETFLFYVSIWNIVFFTFFIVAAPALFTGKGSFRPSLLVKTPTILASFAGLLFFALSISLPEIITENLTLVGNMTTPLSMIFIGITLAKIDFRQAFTNRRLWLTTAMRLVLLPALLFCLLRLFTQDTYLLAVPTLLVGLPVAALTSILAEMYQADVALASQLVLLSTLISMITIPALVYLLLFFF